MSLQLRFGARSDVGLQRHNNQDAMYAGPHLIAVADGVGGAAGGEVASRLTIAALLALDTDPLDDPQAAFRGAADSADASIRRRIGRDPGLAGMSTTLTAILATDDQLVLAHIGDSRAYRLRDGVLSQLTRDHTLVQSLIDDGQITEEEALTHPRRSWIMRALDGRGEPELDLIPIDVVPGDRYLVCSDGLSSYVGEEEIAAGLADNDPQAAADRLTDLALKAGGSDNITCVVADPVEDAAAAPAILGGSISEDDLVRTDLDTAAEPATPRSARRRETRVDDSDEREVAHRSIGRRLAAVASVVIILIAAGVAGTAVYIHHQWYIAPSDGKVAVFQGVKGKAVGLHFSHVHVLTNLPVSALPQDDRERVTSGIQTSGGQAGASDVVSNLRQEACASATPTPTPQPTTSSSHHKHQARVKALAPMPRAPVWCPGSSQ